ncbi:hypothetical protein D9757_009361 [Collybiopsis confluens]|uniref:Uncharacterized protein n=1 Tax=Collybiopsis confluens TaxID=2823264 RepID=A0A8H5H6T1_9AGAR|nr:hypothetical protein D9757_009361 [Collybiopsis confluens]
MSPQVRKQAQRASKKSNSDNHYAFLQIGHWFSLLLFNRKDEEQVVRLEQESKLQTPKSKRRRLRLSSGCITQRNGTTISINNLLEPTDATGSAV